ncbi:hypothetical protein BDP55DRAFT_644109 [Colletotrichum godetiae]|uniref:DUF8035 domain-containing protein n=1 Tax=Colletotrichum godetiae TaxID=1209918 RepID=A0AAJ0F035_9PEZI|nr:uncharacterized protein BDP55DRAFT_644109 [Colletotrichum godetiae]KAK1700768.1 hypothetical protein BDP55DRAFT_644109 [Colletotrichum godetiae]
MRSAITERGCSPSLGGLPPSSISHPLSYHLFILWMPVMSQEPPEDEIRYTWTGRGRSRSPTDRSAYVEDTYESDSADGNQREHSPGYAEFDYRTEPDYERVPPPLNATDRGDIPDHFVTPGVYEPYRRPRQSDYYASRSFHAGNTRRRSASPRERLTRFADRVSFSEDADRDGSRSASKAASDITSASDRSDTYPKKGKTRIPIRLVSKRALIDLGYPFIEEGNTIIVLKALGQNNIDELLKASEEYKRVELEITGQDHSSANTPPVEVIAVDIEPLSDTDGTAPGPRDGTSLDSAHNRYATSPTVGDNGAELGGLRNGQRYQGSNQVHLSGVFSLNPSDQPVETQVSSSELSEAQKAWNTPKSCIENGTVTTELINIHAAEHYMGQASKHKVTLYCPNSPHSAKFNASKLRMRWLHLEGPATKLRAFENLVADCPFINHELRAVALNVLVEAFRRCKRPSELGSEIEPGAVIRYIGRPDRFAGRYRGSPVFDTEAVAFLSVPFLNLSNRISPVDRASYTSTILEYLYGYDAGVLRHAHASGQGVMLEEELVPRTIRVPQMWSLIIGSSKH